MAEMRTLFLESHNASIDFAAAKQLASKAAEENLEEPLLLSWYDGLRDMESPSGVSECHDQCEVPGCVEYAENRGGVLVVNIDKGNYLFCYRELGEFA